MPLKTTLPIYNRLLDFIIEKASPQEILAFQASEEEKEYIQELVDRQSEGVITPEEAAYLDQIIEFEAMVSVLKTKAMSALNRAS